MILRKELIQMHHLRQRQVTMCRLIFPRALYCLITINVAAGAVAVAIAPNTKINGRFSCSVPGSIPIQLRKYQQKLVPKMLE